jgi:hypothetical protein
LALAGTWLISLNGSRMAALPHICVRRKMYARFSPSLAFFFCSNNGESSGMAAKNGGGKNGGNNGVISAGAMAEHSSFS